MTLGAHGRATIRKLRERERAQRANQRHSARRFPPKRTNGGAPVTEQTASAAGAPVGLWRAAVARDPARPFLTHYDDATGERVELSFATTDNWVAKTANLIVDDLGAEPGERIALWLPTHWQTVVWYLACWSTGAVAAPTGDPAQCEYAVADADRVAQIAACRGGRVLVGLRAFGAPPVPTPPGLLDYAAEVAAHADRFSAPAPDADAAAMDRAGAVLTGAQTGRMALAAAGDLGLTRYSRVLFAGDLSTEAGLSRGLLGPLAAGASVVLCRNPDSSRLPGRVRDERVTHRFG
jgi:uncharacterized protein (TIGR03089 family)